MWIVYFPFIQELICFKKAVVDDQIVLSGLSLYETVNHQFKRICWQLVPRDFFIPLQAQATHLSCTACFVVPTAQAEVASLIVLGKTLAVGVYCHASKKIFKSLNRLVSDFQRCWAHMAVFNFNYEYVHSAFLRTRCLEPMKRCLDWEVCPQGRLCSPYEVTGRTCPGGHTLDVGWWDQVWCWPGGSFPHVA